MNSILKKNIGQIKTYCKKHNVRNLYAFGSSVTDQFTDKSDIDLLVSFKDANPVTYTANYFELYELFEKLFNRKIDLITDNSLHNPYFIDSINAQKKLLYAE